MAHERQRSGPRSPFGPKSLPTSSHSLTEFAKQILGAAAERYGTSESNIVEALARIHRWDEPETDALLRSLF